ncbi:hypothetical protein NZD89_11130 [Alicyclobacillus fastidiosus]|uniref:Uncharacterized protein n=1 Tax=Alicyclobacillus fastidiosus TaxID=392011 RepID=A0ABY6ZM10_9BACL|nr:hypothetical protein [Alicyclobacillus fastidiosus]WAH43884.1 hypothetical protein NZD89_11130 [Alicyclobacillus fastidiosus]GMA60126.1 hypothetical protein GCM10025859_05660 [Alicyclobacillus fastidiosus]
MNSSIRLFAGLIAAFIAWAATRVLSASPTVALTIGTCVFVFGVLSTGRTYLLQRRLFRGDLWVQHSAPVVAGAIVATIVRMTHF